MQDTFGRSISYMRMSVTELCDLRCRYCMPEHGVCKRERSDMLTEEEMLLAVRAAASLGIKKLRITGGEPLVKKNIVSICSRAAETPGIEEVCITTNGILLPKYARALRDGGVKRVNLSLDTLDAEKYAYITRRGRLSDALAGLRAALSAGFDRVKINTVLIGGFNDGEIERIALLTLKYPVDVRFIELMPMYDGGEFGPEAYIPDSVVPERLPQLKKTGTDGVARRYMLPGAMGSVGLISPVSAHFCAECSRIRLTADGHIKPCLHSETELSVKGLGYDEMVQRFRQAILSKPRSHAELSAQSRSHAGRNMNEIGG